MATKTTIAIDVNLTAGQAEKELDSLRKSADAATNSIDAFNTETSTLKQQLAEAVKQAEKLSIEFGINSKEAVEAQKKVGALKSDIADFNERINAFNPSNKFTALSEAMVKVSGGFEAAAGAMALFGSESEDVQKALLKVQGAMALAQGIDQMRGLGGALKNFKTIALDVLGSIKTAIMANPLLALASVIIGVSTAVYTWLTAESDLAEQIKKSKEEEAKRLELTEKHYDREIMKAKALGKEVTSLERQKMLAQLESAKQQLELDKQLEKSNLKQAQSRIYLLSLTNETFKKTYDNVTKILDNFDKYSEVAFEEQNESIRDIEAKLSADRLKMIADTNTAMVKSTEDRYKKEQELADKAKAQREKDEAHWKKVAEDEKAFDDAEMAKREKESADLEAKRLKELEEEQAFETAKAGAALEVAEWKYDELEKKEREHQEMMQRNREFAMQSTMQGLQLISDIAALYGSKNEKQAKRAFEIQKAVSIAQTLIETYKAAQGAYASQQIPGDPSSPIRGAIAAAFAVASGLVRVAAIRKQQFNAPSMGGGASSGGGSIPNMDVSGGSQPTFGSTELNRQAIESGKSITIENNISETEITKKQQRVGVIQSRATID